MRGSKKRSVPRATVPGAEVTADRNPCRSNNSAATGPKYWASPPALVYAKCSHAVPVTPATASREALISASAVWRAAKATFTCVTVCAPIVHPLVDNARTWSHVSITPARAWAGSSPALAAALAKRLARSAGSSGTNARVRARMAGPRCCAGAWGMGGYPGTCNRSPVAHRPITRQTLIHSGGPPSSVPVLKYTVAGSCSSRSTGPARV